VGGGNGASPTVSRCNGACASPCCRKNRAQSNTCCCCGEGSWSRISPSASLAAWLDPARMADSLSRPVDHCGSCIIEDRVQRKRAGGEQHDTGRGRGTSMPVCSGRKTPLCMAIPLGAVVVSWQAIHRRRRVRASLVSAPLHRCSAPPAVPARGATCSPPPRGGQGPGASRTNGWGGARCSFPPGERAPSCLPGLSSQSSRRRAPTRLNASRSWGSCGPDMRCAWRVLAGAGGPGPGRGPGETASHIGGETRGAASLPAMGDEPHHARPGLGGAHQALGDTHGRCIVSPCLLILWLSPPPPARLPAANR